MTDFDYENMQKKITARGAYHKKGGSKSRKCTLPSDYMTKAQKEALNGPFTTILLNQPMDWATFKSLSDTLKKTYLVNLKNTYNPNTSMLARMFGVTPNPVAAELRKHGLPTGLRGAKPNKSRQAAWDAFCNGVIGGGDNVQPEEEAPAEEPKEEAPAEEPKEEAPAEEPKATVWDVDPEKLADALEEAKRIAEEDEGKDKEPTGFADAVRQHNLNLCDPAHPDHVNARRCDDPEPVELDPEEELADAILDAFNKACKTLPCQMHRLETSMTGAPETVMDSLRDLLSLFSGIVKVEIKIFADKGYGGDAD